MNTKCVRVAGLSIALVLFAVAPILAQQTSLRLNAPYQCGNGMTVTVTRCAQQYCSIKLEKNGVIILQGPGTREHVITLVNACVAKGGGGSAQPGRAVGSLNPPYLSEFPSVGRVLQAMKVAGPQETYRRQIGAFYELSEIIKELSGHREFRGYLPDEKKLLGEYSVAQYKVGQAADKAFPGKQLSHDLRYHFSRWDPRFGFEGVPVWQTFFAQTNVQSQFARAVGAENKRYATQIEQQKRAATQTLQANSRATRGQSSYAGTDHGGRDEMRRCMESGRSDMECLGEGLKASAVDLVGANPLKGIVPEVPAGLRLTGLYSSVNLHIAFDQSRANVGCGNLIPQPLPYTVQRSGYQLVVKISTSPKPLILSYRTDGKLAGPGTIEVAGLVVTGPSVATTTHGYEMQQRMSTPQGAVDPSQVSPSQYEAYGLQQNGSVYSSSKYNTYSEMTPTTQTHYSVPTAQKTESCSAAALLPTSPTPTVTGLLTQFFGTHASNSQNTAPGLRMNGTYSSPGGVEIEFRSDSATLECGAAQHSEAYALLPEGGRLVVKFQNDTGPFALTLEPNGTLTGSGILAVDGREMTGYSGNNPIYVPRNARCTIGTLTPSK